MEFNFNSNNTFCISLLSHKSRTEKMQYRFKELNLEVSIWNASTKDSLNNNFIDYLNDGQKGCAQSHFNLWNHIINNNIDYALILEDDACFDKQFYTKMNSFGKDIKDTEWDAIFLNASEEINIINTWTLVNNQYLTGGYILSKRGAHKLLNMFSSCLYGADWMTSRLQTYGHSYSYFPWLIIQEGTDTTIGGNINEDHAKVIRLLNKINYSLDNYIF